MTMRLYTISGSPYAWRVHLALEHKGADYEVQMLSASAGDLRKDSYLALNPRGQVPTFVDGDFVLYESGAILEYLDDRLPEAPKLFPGDARRRALVRRLGREVDLYCWPHHWSLAQNLFFKPDPSTWNQSQIEEGRAGWLSELESFERAMKADYMTGDTLSAADFSLYPFVAAFARFEKRKPELAMTASLGPKLTAWKARIESLPYFGKTFPPHWR